MRPLVFQTKMSVVFWIRESVVLYCIYLCFQTKMSVVVQIRESVVYIGIFVENCRSANLALVANEPNALHAEVRDM